ncbi:DUF2225 domain-containing protein [Exiguobacterium antarcticum]|uniref:DUF2225 domain-containing protein n=1 Tax=Exiguobacterium antarcticum TaxID=132920 RepID=UPI000285E819|nr:DUF2225 domain-containing protein [Exiguobacterium antarcticum]AFS71375.1 Hypothetical protein Eab7_2281 [Exiguobacterium antarcticum B7]
MSDLYMKKCRCPYCLKETATKRVLSRHIRVDKTDRDGMIHYKGSNVYYYEPVQCTHCRFLFHDTFGKLTTDVRETIATTILPSLPVLPFASTERTADQALQLYKLCLYTAQITRQKDAIQAMLGVRIAWLYRLLENREQELLWTERTVLKYEALYAAYLDPIQTGIPEETLLLRLADLYAVLDRTADARKWYSVIFQSKTVSDRIKKDARQHWELYREQHDL